MSDSDKITYGVDLRLRDVLLPSGLMGLFVAHVPGGSSSFGWGFDLVRRHGTTELQLGFEHESIAPAEGVWIESGKNVAQGDSADYILSPNDAPESFGWYTIEFTFINHAVINKYLAVRYGGGAGIGILSGGVYRWDINGCAPGATNDSPTPSCVPVQKGGPVVPSFDNGSGAESSPQKYNFPGVFPVVNAIIGLQIRPVDRIYINIEGGLRTLPFFGVSVGGFVM